LHNVLPRFYKRWSAGSKLVLRTQNITQKLLLFLSRKRSRLKMEQQLKPYDCLEIKDMTLKSVKLVRMVSYLFLKITLKSTYILKMKLLHKLH